MLVTSEDAMATAPTTYTINDPKHWRDCAAEVRLLAGDMRDLQAKAAMYQLAKDYEHLAERAEQRTKISVSRSRRDTEVQGPI